jgi:hypothetical protein
MLNLVVTLLVIALIAAVLGFGGIAMAAAVLDRRTCRVVARGLAASGSTQAGLASWRASVSRSRIR